MTRLYITMGRIRRIRENKKFFKKYENENNGIR